MTELPLLGLFSLTSGTPIGEEKTYESEHLEV